MCESGVDESKGNVGASGELDWRVVYLHSASEAVSSRLPVKARLGNHEGRFVKGREGDIRLTHYRIEGPRMLYEQQNDDHYSSCASGEVISAIRRKRNYIIPATSG